MTLAQLALTVMLLGGLGLVANRFGLSAIPAYLLAGLPDRSDLHRRLLPAAPDLVLAPGHGNADRG